MCAVNSYNLNNNKDSNEIMSGIRGYCVAQLFGAFLFCLGMIDGIIIGIYVYSEGPDTEVFCKNFPDWFINEYQMSKTVPTKYITTAPETATEVSDYDCTLCKTKKFSYTINNQLREPYFNNSITMEIEDEGIPLIKYMESAVDDDNEIFSRFAVSYYSGIGYFIKSINNVTSSYAEDRTFWQISTSEGPIFESISSFVPTDGAMVLVNFTCSSR